MALDLAGLIRRAKSQDVPETVYLLEMALMKLRDELKEPAPRRRKRPRPQHF
jgi:hypothetical protein